MWRSMRTKLVVVQLLLILFSLQLIGAYFVRALTASLIHSQTTAVQSQAELLATIAAPTMGGAISRGTAEMAPLLTSFPQLLMGSVYLLNTEGVVADTSAGSALIGQKRIDSVATQALVSRRQITAIRFDPLNQQHLLAVAVPMFNSHNFVGVAEYVVSIQNTYETVKQVTAIFYTGSIIALVMTALLGIILSRTIARPVLDVTGQARKMASGNFTQRVKVRSDDEFGDLAKAINELADKLEDALAVNAREQERLSAVIKYMGDGVIVFDSALQPRFANDAASRLLPRGKNGLHEAATLLGLDLTQIAKNLGGYATLVELRGTLLNVLITPIHKNQQIEGYVAILRDVTEQEKLNQSRRDFVANVSHELRTPLTSIKSYIEVLQEDAASTDSDTRKKFLTVVAQQTDRMVRLTHDLLQLSGLDNRVNHDAEVLVSVEDWLTHSLQRFRIEAQTQGVEMSLEEINVSGLTGGQIRGDRDMLDRVLDNLISNALKYTASGGKIDISYWRSQGIVTVQVKDTGIGIPKDDLPHVFERFYRVDKARSRRKGGTGLGLAIAREITERHGGRIEIDSKLKQGTTVTVLLPLAEEVPQ